LVSPECQRYLSGTPCFLGVRGGRLDPRTARRIVHRRLREAGTARDTGPHGLRHRAATRLLEAVPTGAPSRRCWALPRPRPRRSTPTCRSSSTPTCRSSA